MGSLGGAYWELMESFLGAYWELIGSLWGAQSELFWSLLKVFSPFLQNLCTFLDF